jgi:hypothetical protein
MKRKPPVPDFQATPARPFKQPRAASGSVEPEAESPDGVVALAALRALANRRTPYPSSWNYDMHLPYRLVVLSMLREPRIANTNPKTHTRNELLAMLVAEYRSLIRKGDSPLYYRVADSTFDVFPDDLTDLIMASVTLEGEGRFWFALHPAVRVALPDRLAAATLKWDDMLARIRVERKYVSNPWHRSLQNTLLHDSVCDIPEESGMRHRAPAERARALYDEGRAYLCMTFDARQSGVQSGNRVARAAADRFVDAGVILKKLMWDVTEDDMYTEKPAYVRVRFLLAHTYYYAAIALYLRDERAVACLYLVEARPLFIGRYAGPAAAGIPEMRARAVQFVEDALLIMDGVLGVANDRTLLLGNLAALGALDLVDAWEKRLGIVNNKQD